MDNEAPETWDQQADAFRRDGYCLVRDLIPDSMLRVLRPAADLLGERWSAKVGDELLRAQGSMVDVPHMRDPVFGELIASPTTLDMLEHLGLRDVSFTDGYVISKPAKSPRLFWHFDWYGWQHSSAHEDRPPQVFVMYYLTDTSTSNGCLRVIPGSHRRRHPLHDIMTDGHAELRAATDLDRAEFADWPDEVSVPVHAGDVIVGDARLLHAAHANTTEDRRTLITLGYQSCFDELDGPVQATLAAKTQPVPASWPPSTRAAVEALHPHFSGLDAPLERTIGGPRR